MCNFSSSKDSNFIEKNESHQEHFENIHHDTNVSVKAWKLIYQQLDSEDAFQGEKTLQAWNCAFSAKSPENPEQQFGEKYLVVQLMLSTDQPES